MSRFEFSIAVPPDHLALAGHFPGHPIVPGVLLLDEATQALERATGRRLLRLQRARFLSALLPGEAAQGHWEVSGARASFQLHATRAGVPVKLAEGTGTLGDEGVR